MPGEFNVATLQSTTSVDLSGLEKGIRDARRKAEDGANAVQQVLGGFGKRWEQVITGFFEGIGKGAANALLGIPGMLVSLPFKLIGVFGDIAGHILSIFSDLVGTAANIGLQVGRSFASAIWEGVKGNALFEQYQVRFKVLLGSTEEARKRLDKLAKFAYYTPFEMPEVVQADLILQNFGLQAEDTSKRFGKSGDQILTIAGDIASGTGQSFDMISELLGRFASGDTGRAIFEMQRLGIVTKEQMKAMGIEFDKAGSLVTPVDEALTKILQVAQEKYGGLMDEQSHTLNGMLSNLSDWKDQTLRKLSEPIFQGAEQQLGEFMNQLNSPAVQQALDNIGVVLAGAFQTVLGYVNDLIMNIPTLLKILGVNIGEQKTQVEQAQTLLDVNQQQVTLAERMRDLQAQKPAGELGGTLRAELTDWSAQVSALQGQIQDLYSVAALPPSLRAGGPVESGGAILVTDADRLPPSIRPIGAGLEWLKAQLAPGGPVDTAWQKFMSWISDPQRAIDAQNLATALSQIATAIEGIVTALSHIDFGGLERLLNDWRAMNQGAFGGMPPWPNTSQNLPPQSSRGFGGGGNIPQGTVTPGSGPQFHTTINNYGLSSGSVLSALRQAGVR